VAGGPAGVPSRRPIARSAHSHRRTDLAHVGDGR
jgi:hypothetical protein